MPPAEESPLPSPSAFLPPPLDWRGMEVGVAWKAREARRLPEGLPGSGKAHRRGAKPAQGCWEGAVTKPGIVEAAV